MKKSQKPWNNFYGIPFNDSFGPREGFSEIFHLLFCWCYMLINVSNHVMSKWYCNDDSWILMNQISISTKWSMPLSVSLIDLDIAMSSFQCELLRNSFAPTRKRTCSPKDSLATKAKRWLPVRPTHPNTLNTPSLNFQVVLRGHSAKILGDQRRPKEVLGPMRSSIAWQNFKILNPNNGLQSSIKTFRV